MKEPYTKDKVKRGGRKSQIHNIHYAKSSAIVLLGIADVLRVQIGPPKGTGEDAGMPTRSTTDIQNVSTHRQINIALNIITNALSAKGQNNCLEIVDKRILKQAIMESPFFLYLIRIYRGQFNTSMLQTKLCGHPRQLTRFCTLKC